MELVGERYQIDGADVLGLCEKYDTPLYVYDAGKIISQYEKMTNAFDYPKTKIYYACKALTNINIIKLFKRLGAGLDTVSIQEVWTALDVGFEPRDIIFTPNCVSFEEYQFAIEKGVKLNIDNLSMLERFGYEYGDSYPICIRINPHIMAGGNKNISVGHIDSKFGISIHQTPLMKRIIDNYNINVEGVHMHTGSEILDAQVFLQGAEILLDIAKDFDSLEYIDFGSGFKIPYKPNDNETNIERVGKEISERFARFTEDYGKELDLMFEPGKYLVSEAGYFFVKANVVKQTTSTIFAGVDSGFNHLIRPMFYDAYHQITNVSKPNAQPRVYTVVGYICETDSFGYNRKIAEIAENDILGFYNAGAYCFEMSSNFNSRFKPAEVIIYKGEDRLIRKRETLEDLTRNQLVNDIFD